MNSVICLLEQAASLYPGQTAVEDSEGSVCYSELRAHARRIAAGLLRMQLSPEPVMVVLPKSISMIECFYGSAYSGHAYVPTDTAAPDNRLQKIINNLHPSAIITNEELQSKMPGLELGDTPVLLYEGLVGEAEDDCAVNAAAARVTDEDPVYVMYTSGSTGEPKGVTIPHRGVIQFALWASRSFGWDNHTVIANQAALYFDVSVMDVYGAPACGGKLILTPEVLFRFPVKLPEFLKEKQVTHIYWVPTVMIHIANSGALSNTELPELKSVAFAGEVMPNVQLNIWRRALPGRIYANLYGPTETDVCTAYFVDRSFDDTEPLPIGKALPNMHVLLLDENGMPVPDGETGEICVAGSGVNLGYWNNPEQTKRSFFEDPCHPWLRRAYYKTGDLGYLNGYGEIMFVGRKDGQIKFRGNRIELGEIENAARCMEGVENVCALFDREKQEIVLCLQSKNRQTVRQTGRFLKNHIPAYMLPQRVEYFDEFPLNANRKIDRKEILRFLEEKDHE